MGQSGVSIIDQSGRLLSYSPDNPDEIMADSQLAYRMRLEGIYRSQDTKLGCANRWRFKCYCASKFRN